MGKKKEIEGTGTDVKPYNSENEYVKSNVIVGSKYKSTLLENKLMAVCMSKIVKASEDSQGTITVRVEGQELRRIFGLKNRGGDFYERLDNAAHNMTGRTIGFSDPETQEFEYHAVVTTAVYKDGVFTCEFNKNMRKYLKNIESNFTQYSLDIMMKFKSNYTFRLYELLKSRAYVPKGHKKTDDFEIIYNLSELKLELGVVNAELDAVKNELHRKKGTPDYDKAVEKSPEKMFEEWYEFKRCVLDVGVKEINKTPETQMSVSYKTQRKGKGGKVHGVIFYVHYTMNDTELEEDVVVKVPELSEAEKTDFYDMVMDLIDEKVKLRDIIAISEAANYNIEIIKEKYELAKGQRNISNIVGWLIDAIRKDYPAPVKAESVPKVKHNFKGRDIDFEELEKIAFE